MLQTELIKANYQSLIFEFGGYKVMIDADLAAIYEVETKRLKEQVKRNIERFPEDCMFELTKDEENQLVANCDRLSNLKHSSVNPMAFSEQGIAMLSSVLRSLKAIKINIEIMRAFAQYRQLLIENNSLRIEIKSLDEKINKAFKYLLDRMDEMGRKNSKRKPIGYKIYKK
jgi:ORF6N domain-containing protein